MPAVGRLRPKGNKQWQKFTQKITRTNLFVMVAVLLLVLHQWNQLRCKWRETRQTRRAGNGRILIGACAVHHAAQHRAHWTAGILRLNQHFPRPKFYPRH